jgi:hypothetical protein
LCRSSEHWGVRVLGQQAMIMHTAVWYDARVPGDEGVVPPQTLLGLLDHRHRASAPAHRRRGSRTPRDQPSVEPREQPEPALTRVLTGIHCPPACLVGLLRERSSAFPTGGRRPLGFGTVQYFARGMPAWTFTPGAAAGRRPAWGRGTRQPAGSRWAPGTPPLGPVSERIQGVSQWSERRPRELSKRANAPAPHPPLAGILQRWSPGVTGVRPQL